MVALVNTATIGPFPQGPRPGPGPHLLLLLMYRRRSSARPLFLSTAVLLRLSWSRILRKSSSSVSSCSRAREENRRRLYGGCLLKGLALTHTPTHPWALQHLTMNSLVPRGGVWGKAWHHVGCPVPGSRGEEKRPSANDAGLPFAGVTAAEMAQASP